MMCMLIIGVGIGVTQTYLFLGVVAVIAGLLMLPFSHEVVSKSDQVDSYLGKKPI